MKSMSSPNSFNDEPVFFNFPEVSRPTEKGDVMKPGEKSAEGTPHRSRTKNQNVHPVRYRDSIVRLHGKGLHSRLERNLKGGAHDLHWDRPEQEIFSVHDWK